jgi:hypothetical protein
MARTAPARRAGQGGNDVVAWTLITIFHRFALKTSVMMTIFMQIRQARKP